MPEGCEFSKILYKVHNSFPPSFSASLVVMVSSNNSKINTNKNRKDERKAATSNKLYFLIKMNYRV